MEMDNYNVLSFIGEGSFGRVFKASHKETETIVALKVLRKKGRSAKDLKTLKQECDIQRHLKHPNIIQMIDSFETETELVVVSEYAEKELHSILAKEGCLNEEDVKKITWDLVSALYYLHSHRVLHRDLKPQNVLLDSSGRAKLCDFGLARIMTNTTHILTSIKGTPLYMAPELIDENPYDHQADLWSLGCIVYELIAGQPPFCTVSIWQLVKMIRHKPVQWPSFISTEARSFLQGLLHKDPSKRMTWPEILEHQFVAGHVLILPEDVQSESPFTRPLTHSQQEAKQIQKDKISKNLRLMKCDTDNLVLADKRQQNLRNIHGVTPVTDCVPISDDDSIRATSAFSVRESLKTDDEDQSHAFNIENARLLRHEYNVMLNSNLVIGDLEKNMALLMKQHTTKNISDNPNDVTDATDCNKELVCKNKNNRNMPKSNTTSQSLESPESTEKCSKELSTGLSKSVPPSYKQKLLQFSREKLRFGSGGHKLTKSIKKSFSFSRSWDKNKSETQHRTSEPCIEIPSNLIDNEPCSNLKEGANAEVIEDNDHAVDNINKDNIKEPSSIELEEWEAFLNSTIAEVMDGDIESLTQLNMVSMVAGAASSAARAQSGGGRVCGAVAALLALPAVSPVCSAHTLLKIQDVYLEANVIYSFIDALNTLMSNKKNTREIEDENAEGACRMVEVCAWVCARSCRGVRQLAAALLALRACPLFARLLAMYTKNPRLAANIVSLLITILQDLPEHAEVVENILFSAPKFNFLCLLEQNHDALRMRVCILICLLCTFCCTAFTAAMHKKWSKKEVSRLESLQTHCNITLNRAARLAIKELSNMPFFTNQT